MLWNASHTCSGLASTRTECWVSFVMAVVVAREGAVALLWCGVGARKEVGAKPG